MKNIIAPFTKDKFSDLKAGEIVMLSGKIYTARDAAHLRIVETINRGDSIPLDLKDVVIYYAGPTPAKPGEKIGSVGPTSSYRMDDLSLPIVEQGITAMIGKGPRSPKIKDMCVSKKVIYFSAIGGAGAFYKECVKEVDSNVIYENLGAEAIRGLLVKNFKVIVAFDTFGNSIYDRN